MYSRIQKGVPLSRGKISAFIASVFVSYFLLGNFVQFYTGNVAIRVN